MSNAAIIVAAGSSSRFGGETPKQFRELCGKPLLSWTIDKFERCNAIDTIIVVVAEEYLLHTSERVVDQENFKKVSKVVIGADSRAGSVLQGLEALPLSTEYVAIHDGARPLISPDDIARSIETAQKDRAAIVAKKVTDTIKRVESGHIISTVDREKLYQAQTPQTFQYDLILEAHRKLASGDIDQATITDDASLIEKTGFKVTVIEPTSLNIKVTTSEEMQIVEAILATEGQ